MSQELYFSLDIETDGPIPGLHSMRSIGVAACTIDEPLIAQYYRKLEPWLGSKPDPDTMAWWQETEEKRAMWQDLQLDAVEPLIAITELDEWIRELTADQDKRPVCAASPAGYDFVFYRWYTVALLGRETPFKHRCLDVRSFQSALFGTEYLKSGKENLNKQFQATTKHSHIAVEDAIEQAEIIHNLLKESRSRQSKMIDYWRFRNHLRQLKDLIE